MSRHLLRTLVFAGIAVVCVAGAVLTNTVTRGKPLDDAALVGEKFYPELAEDDDITAMQVAAYDDDAAEVNLFKVEFKDGLWRIPSHHDYPADGEELLAKTAASVVGLTRGTFAGKTEADQRRTRTLDPLDESITGTEGRGDRITLLKGNTPVVDLIVGDRTDDAAGDVYYVREADNPKIYRTRMSELTVSTKFADWIEPDLLQLDRNNLAQLVLDRYHIDEQRSTIVQEEITELNKNDEDKWQLEGLDEATEELKTNPDPVSDMTFALGDMKIVGVRPKPSGLVKLLTSEDGRVSLSDIEIIQMRSSMSRAGFVFANQQIYSNEGEFRAGTNEGVVYQLRFGEVFSGTDVEIEVGSTDEAEDDQGAANETEDDSNTDQDDAESTDETTDEPESQVEDESDDDSSVKRNRYLLVMTHFDESLLGEPPQTPVKPEPPGEEPETEDAADEAADPDKPAADDPSDEDASDKPEDEKPGSEDESADPGSESESDDESTSADDKESTDEPATEESSDDQAKPEADSADAGDDTDEGDDKPETAAEDAEAEPAEEPVDPQQAYEEAVAQYEIDLVKYESEKLAYDAKVETGQKRVAELNRRFAAWYYVISAELFDQLHVSRDDLVQAKEPAEGEEGSAEPDGEATPGSEDSADPQPETEADKPEDESEQESESEPSDEDSSSDEASRDDESKPEADPPSESEKPANDSAD